MTDLVLASGNKGKIAEIRQILDGVRLLSLADVGFTAAIDEPFHTFEENARVKAEAIHAWCGKNVMADDSGICVQHLGGAPGVDSAHYSGERDDDKNLQKVLHGLHGVADRSACYKAVICLIWDGETHYFEGVCKGHILEARRGSGGFGYDPIFVPDGYTQSFAELPPETKNAISHRGLAVKKMAAFIQQNIKITQA